MLRRAFLIFCVSMLVWADDVARKIEDYPAKMVAGPVTFGIENLGPGVPSPSGSIYLDRHIAIEVGRVLKRQGQSRDAGVRQLLAAD